MIAEAYNVGLSSADEHSGTCIVGDQQADQLRSHDLTSILSAQAVQRSSDTISRKRNRAKYAQGLCHICDECNYILGDNRQTLFGLRTEILDTSRRP